MEKIGTFQAKIILAIFYFTLLAIPGLIISLFSDPLMIRKKAKTYWIEWTKKEASLKEAKNQWSG